MLITILTVLAILYAPFAVLQLNYGLHKLGYYIEVKLKEYKANKRGKHND